MSETVVLKRNLKIKSGAVKRLLKDHTGYKNEVTELQLKHDKLVADGADEWDVKNAARMTEESRKMVQDVDERLGSNVQDLRDLIVRAQKIEELVGSDELLAADDILEEASV